MIDVHPFCAKKFINKNFYDHRARWIHYFNQIRRVASLKRDYTNGKEFSVLEVGSGHGVVTNYLKTCGISIQTLDNDPRNKPDICCSVVDIDTHVPPESFDLVIACEILEHLPFQSFASILRKMKDVTRQFVFISVPDSRRILFQSRIKLPMIKKQFLCSLRIPGPIMKVGKKGHQWELGRRGYPRSRVIREIEKSGLRVMSHYSHIDTPQNYYFVLSKHRENFQTETVS